MTPKLPAEQASRYDRILLKLKSFIFAFSDLIQYVVAITIILAIVLSLVSIPYHLGVLAIEGMDHMMEYLEFVVNIIIAIELVHVLTHQTLDSIVEILPMDITRELVLQHLKTYEILIGVMAIALLFVMRKYLFIAKLDDDDDAQHRHKLSHIHGDEEDAVLQKNTDALRSNDIRPEAAPQKPAENP